MTEEGFLHKAFLGEHVDLPVRFCDGQVPMLIVRDRCEAELVSEVDRAPALEAAPASQGVCSGGALRRPVARPQQLVDDRVVQRLERGVDDVLRDADREPACRPMPSRLSISTRVTAPVPPLRIRTLKSTSSRSAIASL